MAQPTYDGDAEASSGPDEDEPSAIGFNVPNGRPSSTPPDAGRTRTASVPANANSDLRGSTGNVRIPSAANPPNGGSHHHGPRGASPPRHASGSHGTAKDSFLNYFFGGAQGTPGMPQQGRARQPLPQVPRSTDGYDSGDQSANPMAGRKGFEGRAAAFNMKSLDKHLEPVRPLRCI